MAVIGGYETIRLLGKGGMSEVYEVENPQLGSRHALKLFTYEKDDSEVRERFQTEGRLLARLNHPRIVKVTDFGTDESSGKPYFVMDLILNEHGEMQLLSDVEPGTVDEEIIGRWYDDLREGLAYIHSNGVIHRDLKLQNVLIGPDGHAVLTDFGISKIFDAKGDGVPIVDTVKTLAKVREGRSLVMGSLGYMAPELEMGVAASPQSDYYALGVIVYRLLTGTWCDARTDVVGTLETYDPAWKRIIPKLLHSNPNGRECLSYADEKRAAQERAELAAEERWLREKERGHSARHVARYVGVLSLLFLTILVVVILRFRQELKRWETRASIPQFSDVCKLPSNMGNVVRTNGFGGSFDRPENALIDAWVLTHGIFDDLRVGKISNDKAIEALQALLEQARTRPLRLFDATPGYTSVGDVRFLIEILKEAIVRMQTLSSDIKNTENSEL